MGWRASEHSLPGDTVQARCVTGLSRSLGDGAKLPRDALGAPKILTARNSQAYRMDRATGRLG